MKNNMGVLCHLTSIPSNYGVGDFGESGKNFIDLLAKHNIKIWQILPLNKTNEFNCPYATTCSYAIDEMFVDPDALINQNLIKRNDLKNLKKLKNTKKVCYTKVKKEKLKLFDIAFSNFSKEKYSSLEKFAKTNPKIKQNAIFNTLLKHYNIFDWRDLPKQFVEKNPVAFKKFADEHKDEINKQLFIQFILYGQWKELLQYAHKKNIKILGDMPIYPDKNSFEVFANPELYKLNKNTLLPAVMGGVPADDFCKNGQNWGTCIYNWKEIEKNNYSYMIEKIKHFLSFCDLLRLDHFAGYVEHYEVNPTTPAKSRWVKEGGAAFFKALQSKIPLKHFVIEDLGVVSKSCLDVKSKFDLVGMKVLQFAFSDKANLPENYTQNDLAYLGTHDNNTFCGFLKGLSSQRKKEFLKLLNIDKKQDKDITIACMKKLIKSSAKVVIFQLQDILLQKANQRMNVPGQMAGCWEYRTAKADKKFDKMMKILCKN